MSRLLIVACSQRKNPAKGNLPAIDRYDGPVFRVIRKYLREGAGEAPSILILSAKYGLITADRQITDYDCCLTRTLAMQLQPHVLETARAILQSREWESAAVCSGKSYQEALRGIEDLVPVGLKVEYIEGGLGRRLTALKRWLCQERSSASAGSAH